MALHLRPTDYKTIYNWLTYRSIGYELYQYYKSINEFQNISITFISIARKSKYMPAYLYQNR